MEYEPYEVSKARIEHGDSSWEGFKRHGSMKCKLNHTELLKEIPDKKLGPDTYVCPDCGFILLILEPR